MGKMGNLFSSLQANCKEHNYQIDIDQITLETKENAQEGKISITSSGHHTNHNTNIQGTIPALLNR